MAVSLILALAAFAGANDRMNAFLRRSPPETATQWDVEIRDTIWDESRRLSIQDFVGDMDEFSFSVTSDFGTSAFASKRGEVTVDLAPRDRRFLEFLAPFGGEEYLKAYAACMEDLVFCARFAPAHPEQCRLLYQDSAVTLIRWTPRREEITDDFREITLVYDTLSRRLVVVLAQELNRHVWRITPDRFNGPPANAIPKDSERQ